jgi:hypothetical protein
MARSNGSSGSTMRSVSPAAARVVFPRRRGTPTGDSRPLVQHGGRRIMGFTRLIGWLRPLTGGLDALVQRYPAWALMAVAQPPI